MASEDLKSTVKELIRELSEEERLLFQQVVRAELEKLHMSKPHGIYDDLERVVRGVIK